MACQFGSFGQHSGAFAGEGCAGCDAEHARMMDKHVGPILPGTAVGPDLAAVAAQWIDDRGDDGSIGHYRESEARDALEALLIRVRTQSLSEDARNAEAMENEACALLVDSLLGDGCKPAQMLRQRIQRRDEASR